MRHIRTIGALALVALLVVSGAAMAAAPTVDSETTHTSSQSVLTDGATVDNFNASDTNLSTLQIDVDSNNPGVRIVDPDSGEVINTVTNESDASRFTATNASEDFYNVTLKETDFAAMPIDAGQNKSVTLRLVNNTTHSAPDTKDITVYLNNTNERAVVFAGDKAADEDVATDTTLDVENASKYWGIGDEVEQATVEHDNVGISGTDTTVYVLYGNDSAQSAFSAAEDRGWVGSFSSGDFIRFHQVALEGNSHPVFLSEVPDGVADGVTYAETTTVSGYDGYAVTLGDTYEDETQVDLTAKANNAYGWDKVFSLRYDVFGIGGFVPGI